MHAHLFIPSPFFFDICSFFLSRSFPLCVCECECTERMSACGAQVTVPFSTCKLVWIFLLYFMPCVDWCIGNRCRTNSHFSPEFHTIFYVICLHSIYILNRSKFNQSNFNGILPIYLFVYLF